ncbi:MFS transporter [Streptomyces sp. NPDC001732]
MIALRVGRLAPGERGGDFANPRTVRAPGRRTSQPARASLVLDLVGRENLSNANALNALAMNMTQVIGPAVGGAMISAFGAPAALWISTTWYAVSLEALWPLRGPGAPTAQVQRRPHAVTRPALGRRLREWCTGNRERRRSPASR